MQSPGHVPDKWHREKLFFPHFWHIIFFKLKKKKKESYSEQRLILTEVHLVFKEHK